MRSPGTVLTVLVAVALAGCGPSTPALLPAYGQRGVLVTRERVRQAPCATGACHARDVVHLRIEEGRAAVTLERRLFDPIAAAWGPPADRTAVAAVVAEEKTLLERIQASRIEVRAGHAGEGCSASRDCAEGLQCLARRCVKTRETN